MAARSFRGGVALVAEGIAVSRRAAHRPQRSAAEHSRRFLAARPPLRPQYAVFSANASAQACKEERAHDAHDAT
jgi:hypothetical protein